MTRSGQMRCWAVDGGGGFDGEEVGEGGGVRVVAEAGGW